MLIHAGTRIISRKYKLFSSRIYNFHPDWYILSCGHNINPDNYIDWFSIYIRVVYNSQNKIFFIRKVYGPVELFTRNYFILHPESIIFLRKLIYTVKNTYISSGKIFHDDPPRLSYLTRLIRENVLIYSMQNLYAALSNPYIYIIQLN